MNRFMTKWIIEIYRYIRLCHVQTKPLPSELIIFQWLKISPEILLPSMEKVYCTQAARGLQTASNLAMWICLIVAISILFYRFSCSDKVPCDWWRFPAALMAKSLMGQNNSVSIINLTLSNKDLPKHRVCHHCPYNYSFCWRFCKTLTIFVSE